MANWTTLVKASGTQPVVIGSVNSFWLTQNGVPDQGDIRVRVNVDSIFTYYSTAGVGGLTQLTNDNSSLFVGMPESNQLFQDFEIRNDNVTLSQKGKMQGLLPRDPGNPNDTLITIYAPHIDFAPLGHIGLIEAFAVSFMNNDPGNPASTNAQAAILSLTSRMWDYTPVSGPAFNGTWTHDMLDQSTSLFAYGGAMTIADATTGDLPVMVIPS